MDPLANFLVHVAETLRQNTLQKLTLSKPARDADPQLRNLYIRPVTLNTGPALQFTHRHATRDITKNHTPDETLAQLPQLLETYRNAHLITPAQIISYSADKLPPRLQIQKNTAPAPTKTAAVPAHNRPKQYPVPPTSP